MTENRPLAKYAWCDWHNWLISHIPKTMKKSVGKIKVCNKEYHQVFSQMHAKKDYKWC